MIVHSNGSNDVQLDENEHQQDLSISSLSSTEKTSPDNELRGTQSSINNENSCNNVNSQLVYENSFNLSTVSNDSCENRELTQNRPSRRVEMALRREVEKLKITLQESNEQCDRLKKKLEKSTLREKTLYNVNRRLSRKLKFCNLMFQDLKYKKSRMKKHAEKKYLLKS